MIKVLHIISDTNIGGAGRYLLTFLEHYDRDRLQVSVMCPPGSQLIDRCQALGVPVSSSPFLTADRSFAGNNLAGLWRELKNLTQQQRLEVVHTHASFAGRLAARLAGVPGIVYTKHRLDWESSKTGWKKWVVPALNRLTCDRVIAISQAVKETLIQEGLPEERIELIYNGIDVKGFRSKTAAPGGSVGLSAAELDGWFEGCPNALAGKAGDNLPGTDGGNFRHSGSNVFSTNPYHPSGKIGGSEYGGQKQENSGLYQGSRKPNQDFLTPTDRPPIVGMVARLEPEKGHRYFLEAAAQICCRRSKALNNPGPGAGGLNTGSLQQKHSGTGQAAPDFSDPASFSKSTEAAKHHRVPPQEAAPLFLIVGDGSLAGELKELARHLQIADRVIFTGFREDVPRLMAAMDVVVVPSLTEAFGLSLIEGMCLGKPCVASAVGGIIEIAEDGRTALLVPPEDGAAIAEKVAWLLQNKEEADALGARAATEIEQRFSARVMVEKMTELYETLRHGHSK